MPTKRGPPSAGGTSTAGLPPRVCGWHGEPQRHSDSERQRTVPGTSRRRTRSGAAFELTGSACFRDGRGRSPAHVPASYELPRGRRASARRSRTSCKRIAKHRQVLGVREFEGGLQRTRTGGLQQLNHKGIWNYARSPTVFLRVFHTVKLSSKATTGGPQGPRKTCPA